VPAQALHRFAHPSRVEYNGALAELEAMLPSNKEGEGSEEDAEVAERDDSAPRAGRARRKPSGAGAAGVPTPGKVKKKPSADDLRRSKKSGSSGSKARAA
jgi:hypothetical protein